MFRAYWAHNLPGTLGCSAGGATMARKKGKERKIPEKDSRWTINLPDVGGLILLACCMGMFFYQAIRFVQGLRDRGFLDP